MKYGIIYFNVTKIFSWEKEELFSQWETFPGGGRSNLGPPVCHFTNTAGTNIPQTVPDFPKQFNHHVKVCKKLQNPPKYAAEQFTKDFCSSVDPLYCKHNVDWRCVDTCVDTKFLVLEHKMVCQKTLQIQKCRAISHSVLSNTSF